MRVRLILATVLSSVPATAFAHPEGPGALGFTQGFSLLALCGLSLGFFSRYAITRERHAAMRAELAAR